VRWRALIGAVAAFLFDPRSNRMASQPFNGVLVPVLTPFTPAGEPDAGRFVAFCRWLLDQGADGLAIFGTTSEANSMAAGERMALLDRLIAAGVPAARLMPGAGACSMTEAATLIRHAVGHGCGGVLMLPPFYYKGMDDDGLFAFFSAVIDRVGSSALRMFLYHIPPQTVLGLSLDLVGRLIKDYPDTVVGLKDSSGDWNNTAALLDRFPGFAVFPGSEVFLLDGHSQGLRKLADAAGRRAAGRDHHCAQDHPSLPDGAGPEAYRRAFPQRPGLGRGAPADAAVERGSVGGIARRSRQDRLHPRRAPPRVKPAG
jgi:4-hydroxy-tetrahydrodipicolinate synthase